MKILTCLSVVAALDAAGPLLRVLCIVGSLLTWLAGGDVLAHGIQTRGARQGWSTFLGGSGTDTAQAVAADSAGNLYVAGSSGASWGEPLRAHAGGDDAFVAKLSAAGVLQWVTFLGSSDDDAAEAVAVDATGDVWVAGTSDATWGSPLNAHAGGDHDGFVARLDTSGNLVWHTFLGSSLADEAKALAVSETGAVFVAGTSKGTWGSPISAHAGSNEVYVARLENSGTLVWNTFMGSGS